MKSSLIQIVLLKKNTRIFLITNQGTQNPKSNRVITMNKVAIVIVRSSIPMRMHIIIIKELKLVIPYRRNPSMWRNNTSPLNTMKARSHPPVLQNRVKQNRMNWRTKLHPRTNPHQKCRLINTSTMITTKQCSPKHMELKIPQPPSLTTNQQQIVLNPNPNQERTFKSMVSSWTLKP